MGLTFNYQAHPSQQLIHDDRGYRFRAVCCGRRWGKTRFAAAELFDIAGERGGLFAWVAPTYYIAERGQKALREIGGDFIQFKGQNPVRATFTGGGGPVEILFWHGMSNELGAAESGAVAALLGTASAIIVGGAVAIVVVGAVFVVWPELARMPPLAELQPLDNA